MDYKLAKELKDAGFPQNEKGDWFYGVKLGVRAAYKPTLSELIEACGDGFKNLYRCTSNPFTGAPQVYWSCDLDHKGTVATSGTDGKFGFETPEEAVARLWLALNKKITS